MHFMVVIIYGLLVSSGAIKDNEDKDKKVKKNVCSDVFPYFDLREGILFDFSLTCQSILCSLN